MVSKKGIFGLLILLGITSLIYAGVRHFEFVWDDKILLLEGSIYTDEYAIQRAIFEPLHISENYYRPLVMLSFILQTKLHGLNAGYFHLINLVLHLCSITILYFYSKRLVERINPERPSHFDALVISALYALHPALSEAVIWISGRFDLFMTALLLMALYIDERFSARKFIRPIGVGLCYLLAIFSKESAILFPVSLLFWHLALACLDENNISASFLKEIFIKNMPVYLTSFFCACLYVVARVYLLGYFRHSLEYFPTGSSLQHLLLVVKAFAFYVVFALLPFLSISPFHFQEMPVPYTDIWAWLAMLAVLVLSIAAVISGRRYLAYMLALAAFTGCLALALFILQIPLQYNLGQERYLQFPVVFICLMLVAFIYPRLPSSGMTKKLALPVLIVWLVISILNIRVTMPLWRDDNSLFTWVGRSQPKCPVCQLDYATALMNNKKLDDAEKVINQVLEMPTTLTPTKAIAYEIYGDVERLKGNRAKAAEYYLKSFDMDVARSSGMLNMAFVMTLMRQFSTAEFYIANVRRTDPNNASAYFDLGMLALAQNNHDEASKNFELAIKYAHPEQKVEFKKSSDELLSGKQLLHFGEKIDLEGKKP